MSNTQPHSRSIILDIETANPSNKLTQKEVLDLVSQRLKPSNRALSLYEKFLMDEGINQRYFAWEDIEALLQESVDQKMKRFELNAVGLSVKAVEKLLLKSKYSALDIDAVFVSTCTGYLCPGLSTYISQQIGLKEDIYTLDLVGLGCTGALPALRAADDYLNRSPDAIVLVIAVEICSAATHWDEKVELILSNSIFSDGAAAILMTNRKQMSGLSIKSISNILWPQFRDQLRFKYQDSRLCNVISSKVPEIVADAIESLEKKTSTKSLYYAFHSGGRKVLDSIEQRLHLSHQEMFPSRNILKEYGNMSSPSVLFTLKDILNQGLKHNDLVSCFSFGAGFLAYKLQAQWSE